MSIQSSIPSPIASAPERKQRSLARSILMAPIRAPLRVGRAVEVHVARCPLEVLPADIPAEHLAVYEDPEDEKKRFLNGEDTTNGEALDAVIGMVGAIAVSAGYKPLIKELGILYSLKMKEIYLSK